MQVPQYDQMLGDNLIADEAADPHERGGNGLTRHQKVSLGAGRGGAAHAELWPGAPCGSCGADEPRVLGRSLAILWAVAGATFVLAAAALGASGGGGGAGGGVALAEGVMFAHVSSSQAAPTVKKEETVQEDAGVDLSDLMAQLKGVQS